ncbi:MAG: ABC transporter permease subunit [Pseudomonadota bacterium]|nr:ABC transporter permease subunit [Pseudomonadota bacterium]
MRLPPARYLLQRIIFAGVTVSVLVSVVFVLVRLTPGGPFDGERQLPEAVEKNLRAAYHLDEPISQQYLRYLSSLLTGDLGPSFRNKDFTVNELIAAGLPTSAALGLLAMTFALISGVTIGTFAGLHPDSWTDRLLMALNNLNLATPTLITAPLLVLLFAVMLSWLPAGGADGWPHFLLPAIALALPFSGAIARLCRGSVMDTLLADHLRTARAKGLGRRQLVMRHVLPLSLLPVLSYLGPASAALITGSVVVEQIFAMPGIGRYFVEGALNNDYTLVMGVVVVYSAFIASFNLLVDLAYAWLDPRLVIAQ